MSLVSAEPDIAVEVVAAWPERQVLKTVRLPAGSTAGQAIDAAELDRQLPGVDLARYDVAVWGRLVSRVQPLKDGDRVEVLRPLAVDPRDARRDLAREGQFMGRRRDREDG